MDGIPCAPGKVAMETLVGLYECLQKLKSKPSQSERLPECIMEKKVVGTKTLLWFSILGFPLETALCSYWGMGGI